MTAIRPLISHRISRLALPALLSLTLAACATGPARLNTDVQAFSTLSQPGPMWQGATYRFDTLPSQAGLNLTPLQNMAQQALAAHGLQHRDEQARYTVQISASVRTVWVNDGWPYPAMGPWGGGWRWGGYGYGYGYGYGAMPPTSTYWREVRLAIQDTQTLQTVYETHARGESPNRDHDAIFSTMLHAALKDFPHSTAGWQHVASELPESSAAPVTPSQVPAKDEAN